MKKGVIVVIVIVVILAVAAFGVLEVLNLNKEPEPLFSRDFPSSENINESEEYIEFSAECNNSGGEIVLGSGGGGKTSCNCYKISSDSSSYCIGDYECQYDCDFSLAINSGVCSLIFTDKDLAAGTYTYSYECVEEKLGRCSSVPIFQPEWTMSGSILTEVGYRDFPQEEGEFSPS